ncbi:nucleoside triphosphate pyrophosphohydrolase [Kushneria pakistanensis]|uniref:Nucleoside triphosphate pyrophosphohydrolase n=1 Tax=Kushneria pakistanensis TaxID=1508770 RepID=A0ABQ3FDL1_9GAMM|nr:nucleoside triphosphate pyrophosphohydrolase [Kushneria pakistanensis]GHC19476.1 nucleoside triphosphate pyrophosphohydrolase [Kushneria pakistanensis]
MEEPQRYTLDDLLTLMQVLRDPQQGCPWDVAQRWESIVPHTLEEAHEVADAIERRAFDELPGELGDLLFQIVYYAQFGNEEGRFDFYDIVHVLTAKMIARHPHVFPDGHLASRRQGVAAADVNTSAVGQRWESRKADERQARAATSLLDDIPLALPALSRARKLSGRASRAGFDWPDHRGALEKIREELAELEVEIEAGHQENMGAELGDLLFAVVNLARHLNIDPEQALRGTGQRFESRFRHVEKAVQASGQPIDNTDLDTLERHWQDAKRIEREQP